MKISATIVLVMAVILPLALATHAQTTSWKDLNDKAIALYEQGRYSEGVEVAKLALKAAEETFGSMHPNVAASLNNLAELYRAQGKYEEAEPLYKRALAIYEKAHGPEHPDVAAVLSNLAVLHYQQGKYAKAEPLYKRALRIYEKALEPEHSDVLTSRGAQYCLEGLTSVFKGLSILYGETGRKAEAKKLEKRIKEIRSRSR